MYRIPETRGLAGASIVNGYYFVGMNDILGQALADYHFNNAPGKLWVYYSDGSREMMPLPVYFRDEDEMPGLELVALQECKGKLLDVGAGAGSHALLLQQRGLDVTAMDISPGAVTVMQDRGVHHVLQQDIFDFKDAAFDTILLLMNGIGIAGTLEGLRRLLQHLKTLLFPGGQLIFDTSDVAYLYKGNPPAGTDPYYGEISCCYAYRRQKTEWFNWLYVDVSTLKKIVREEGWQMELLLDDGDDHFLVRLRRKGE